MPTPIDHNLRPHFVHDTWIPENNMHINLNIEDEKSVYKLSAV